MSTHIYSQREAFRFGNENARSALKSDPSKIVRRLFVGGLFALSLVGFTGCGKKGPTRVQVFPVEGQLLVNGKPLPDVQIFLHPKSNDRTSLSAQAKTDADGKFKVTTYEAGDGAAPGEYSVTVQHCPVVKGPDGYVVGPNVLPPKLAAVATTDWKIQVAQQPNVLPVKTIAR